METAQRDRPPFKKKREREKKDQSLLMDSLAESRSIHLLLAGRARSSGGSPARARREVKARRLSLRARLAKQQQQSIQLLM